MDLLTKYAAKITALCRKYKVGKLFAFGSVLTDKFSEQSDVDLVVDFENVDPVDYADNYFDLKDELSKILGREIDLLEDKAIHNPILRKKIDNTKQLIYG